MDETRKRLGLKPRRIAFSGVTSQTINDDPTYQSRRFEPSKAYDPDTFRRAEVALCNAIRDRPGGLPLTVGGMMSILPATKSVHPSAMQQWKHAVEAALCTHWGWTKKGPAPDSEEATPPPSWQNLQSAGRGYTMKAPLSLTDTNAPSMSNARRLAVARQLCSLGGIAFSNEEMDEQITDPASDKANEKVLIGLIEQLFRERRRALSMEEIRAALEKDHPELDLSDIVDIMNGSRLTLDGQLRPRFETCYEDSKLLYGMPGVTFHENSFKNPILTAHENPQLSLAKPMLVKPVISEARRRELVEKLWRHCRTT
jgi:hypothetical protein